MGEQRKTARKGRREHSLHFEKCAGMGRGADGTYSPPPLLLYVESGPHPAPCRNTGKCDGPKQGVMAAPTPPAPPRRRPCRFVDNDVRSRAADNAPRTSREKTEDVKLAIAGGASPNYQLNHTRLLRSLGPHPQRTNGQATSPTALSAAPVTVSRTQACGNHLSRERLVK